MNEPNFYKIVQTIENGKALLSPVPRLWEHNGILMWPPKNKKDMALKNPLMIPGTAKDEWTQYNCILKRSFIPTYSQALAEIRAMSDRSDTSESELMLAIPKPSKKRSAVIRKKKNQNEESYNFNQLVQTIQSKSFKCEQEGQNHEPEIDQEQQAWSYVLEERQQIETTQQIQEQQRGEKARHENPLQDQRQQQIVQYHQEEPQYHQPQPQQQHGQLGLQPCDNQQLQQNQHQDQMFVVGDDGEIHLYPTCVETNGGNTSTGLNSGVLISIVESIARLEKRLEFLIAQQEQHFGQQLNTTETKKVNFEIQNFKPIDSIDELTEFEKKLENKEFINDLCPKFYCVCGPATGLVGDNISYKFVDALFSRRLFTLVSWTGNSRIKKNESFSRFTNTFKFFFHLVQRCDSSYTEANLKQFFLKIINNSKRRYEVSLPHNTIRRMSSVRHFGSIQKRRKDPKSNEVPKEMDSISIEVDNEGGKKSFNTSNSDVDTESACSSDTLI